MKILRFAGSAAIVAGGFVFAGIVFVGHFIMNGIGLILCAITQG